jgi:hypothetical protein
VARLKKDAPGPDVSGKVKEILGGRSFKLPGGQLGVEVGRMLAEIAVEMQDKIDEAKTWRLRFEVMRGELRTVVAVTLKNLPKLEGKLVITRAEFDAVPENLEVQVDVPEEGVRVYRLVDVRHGGAVSPLLLQ